MSEPEQFIQQLRDTMGSSKPSMASSPSGEHQHVTGAAGAQGRPDQPDVASHDVAVALPRGRGTSTRCREKVTNQA